MDIKGVKVKSLYKAVKLLELFTVDNPERGIKELAEPTGMLSSSVYNILSTFQACGMIEKSRSSSKYRLGKKIMELANVMYTTDDVKQAVKPVMDTVAEKCRETVLFAYPSDTDVIYADASFPRDAHFTRAIAGVRAEMHCTSIGKAILAFLGDEAIRRVVDKGLKGYTPYTLTNGDALRSDLEEVRRRGYAVDNMEHEYGIRCVGVPIRNRKGDVIGGLSISGPSLRIMDDKLIYFADCLKAAAEEIRERLN